MEDFHCGTLSNRHQQRKFKLVNRLDFPWAPVIVAHVIWKYYFYLES